MAIKKHGARVKATARADIRTGRATGRAYIVTDTAGYPAYVVMPDGEIDRFTTRPSMPERLAIMTAWVTGHNAKLDTLDGGN